MIIVVGSVKGGTGKTTISTNIAVTRAQNSADVLLVDADVQNSASDFAAVREQEAHDPIITCTSLIGKMAGGEIRKLEPKFDDIIIDVGGRDSTTLRSVLLIADVLVVPFLPSQLDAWALEQMNDLVESVVQLNENLRSIVVLNKVDTNPRVDLSSEAMALAKDYENLNIHQNLTLGYRVAYRRSVAEGLAVTELPRQRKDAKAVEEIKNVYKEVFKDA